MVTRDKVPQKLIDDLKKLAGLPPYDEPSNLVRGDGYFAASLERKYGLEMVEAARQLVIRPLQIEYTRMKDGFARRTR